MTKKIGLTFLLFFFLQNNFAQTAKPEIKDSISKWSKVNKVGLDISQISFVNWNAGGNNSISGLLRGHFVRTYVSGNLNWKNELITRYGINKQEGQEVRKTDDQLQINSTIGYRKDTISNWYYA